MAQEERDKILQKIKKILELKKGAEEIGSLDEAANAAARISELLLKYNLELSDIPGEKPETSVIIKEITFTSKEGFNKSAGDWIINLICVISKHNMVKPIIIDKAFNLKYYKRLRVDLIGEQHNIDTVEYLTIQMLHAIKKLRLEAFNKHKSNYPGSNKNAYFRSYGRAFVAAIASKLKEQEERLKIEYSQSTALIVQNDKLINQAVEENYGRLGTIASRKLSNNSGARDGWRDGSNTQLVKGINEGK